MELQDFFHFHRKKHWVSTPKVQNTSVLPCQTTECTKQESADCDPAVVFSYNIHKHNCELFYLEWPEYMDFLTYISLKERVCDLRCRILT